jgi:hypothetical protein
MEKYILIVSVLVNAIISVFVFLTYIKQKGEINRMKDFNSIFDIDKVKNYASLVEETIKLEAKKKADELNERISQMSNEINDGNKAKMMLHIREISSEINQEELEKVKEKYFVLLYAIILLIEERNDISLLELEEYIELINKHNPKMLEEFGTNIYDIMVMKSFKNIDDESAKLIASYNDELNNENSPPRDVNDIMERMNTIRDFQKQMKKVKDISKENQLK